MGAPKKAKRLSVSGKKGGSRQKLKPSTQLEVARKKLAIRFHKLKREFLGHFLFRLFWRKEGRNILQQLEVTEQGDDHEVPAPAPTTSRRSATPITINYGGGRDDEEEE